MKKGLFSKLIICGILILNIIFTIWVLAVFNNIGTEPSTLISCWFAFTTGELWMLSSIKKTKTKSQSNDEYYYSTEKKGEENEH